MDFPTEDVSAIEMRNWQVISPKVPGIAWLVIWAI